MLSSPVPGGNRASREILFQTVPRCDPRPADLLPHLRERAPANPQRRAATTENLLPAILAAVESYATIGEISDALRRLFGEYQESVII